MNIAPVFLENDPRWQALCARDRAFDGRFFFAVRSTGVYCRPSCPARRPSPANVVFHASAADAEAAGFRPCKRCHPDRAETWIQNMEVIAAVCRLIDTAERVPSLARLAAQAGFSPYHLQRMFKAATGVTPAAYARAKRAERVRNGISAGQTITEALHEAGFTSGSFYSASDELLGMAPGRLQAGGAGEDIRFAIGDSALGRVLVAQSGRGICAILMGDDAETLTSDLRRRFPEARLLPAEADFQSQVAAVVSLIETPRPGMDLPPDIRGTAFQQRVWQALRNIPPGETASYTQIAAAIGQPGSARAVAGACAANPIAVAVPCHRVVRTGGDLSGYRWGTARKRALLDRERE